MDREVCGDLGPTGAHCAHTLIDATRDIPKAQWDVERIGWLCMSSQAYTDIETAVDQFCTDNPLLCTYQTREALRQSFQRIRQVILK